MFKYPLILQPDSNDDDWLIQSWFSQHDGTLGLWHAGCYWHKANDVKQLILRTGFVFLSVIRKRSRLSSSFMYKQPKYTTLHPIKPATALGFQPAEKTSFVAIN